jgi:glycosyltransferase involved in cell wall biosynthesis
VRNPGERPIGHAAPPQKRRALIVVPFLATNDAVGFDTLAIRDCLAAEGWETAVHCGTSDPAVRDQVDSEALDWLSDPATTLVYVTASPWDPIEELIDRAAGPLVMRYHAGPPPELFHDSDPDFHAEITRYWEQIRRIAPLFDRYLAVSSNAAERLAAVGADGRRIRVTGVFHNIEALHRVDPDQEITGLLAGDPRKLVLSVSRLGAQKGQADIVRIAKHYLDEHTGEAHFLLVGGRQQDGYAEQVERLIRDLGLEQEVILPGILGPAGLRACYERADAFISMSRSESFCLPIIEAQSFGVPVIAHAAMAVPDTLGEGGILIDEVDPSVVAQTLHQVLHNDELRARLTESGLANVERFAPQRIAHAVIDGIAST